MADRVGREAPTTSSLKIMASSYTTTSAVNDRPEPRERARNRSRELTDLRICLPPDPKMTVGTGRSSIASSPWEVVTDLTRRRSSSYPVTTSRTRRKCSAAALNSWAVWISIDSPNRNMPPSSLTANCSFFPFCRGAMIMPSNAAQRPSGFVPHSSARDHSCQGSRSNPNDGAHSSRAVLW